MVVVYVLVHAIQIRYVALTQGLLDGFGLVLCGIVPWGIALLALFGPRARGEPGGSSAAPFALWKWGVVAIAFSVTVSAVWALWRSNGYPLILDEDLYLFQANLFRHGHLVWTTPDTWRRFVSIQQAVVSHGRVYSQYPPGWPGLLAVWSLAAPSWLLGPLMVGLLVAAAVQVGRSLSGPAVALVAGVLAATSGVLLYWGATLMSDLPTASVIAASAAAVTLAAARDGRWRHPWMAVSGALLGLAFAMRPLTGVTAAPLVLAVMARCRTAALSQDQRGVWTDLGAMALGGLPLVAGVLAYNLATTGDALRFGYEQASGSLHNLGFGLRGFTLFDQWGRAVSSGSPFTLGTAVVASGRQLSAFDQSLLGGFLVPVLSAAMLLRCMPRWLWWLVAAAIVLPLVHVLWFFTDSRYYLPLAPFLAIVAATCDATCPRSARLALRGDTRREQSRASHRRHPVRRLLGKSAQPGPPHRGTAVGGRRPQATVRPDRGVCCRARIPGSDSLAPVPVEHGTASWRAGSRVEGSWNRQRRCDPTPPSLVGAVRRRNRVKRATPCRSAGRPDLPAGVSVVDSRSGCRFLVSVPGHLGRRGRANARGLRRARPARPGRIRCRTRKENDIPTAASIMAGGE
jgi:hypothetical protein